LTVNRPLDDVPVEVVELLAELTRRGIRLHSEGGRFVFDSATPTLTDDLVEKIQRHRERLLVILAMPERISESP
jgi:hypothetical protein